MAGEEKHIDQIIRKKFENFAPVPPESVWLDVKAKIGGQPGGTPAGSSIIMPVITGLTIVLTLTVALLNYFTDIPVTSSQVNDSETVFYAAAGFNSDLGFQQPQQDINGKVNVASYHLAAESLDDTQLGYEAKESAVEFDESTQTAPDQSTANMLSGTAPAALSLDPVAEQPETAEKDNNNVQEAKSITAVESHGTDPAEQRIDENIHMLSYGNPLIIELDNEGRETTLPGHTISAQAAYDDYMEDHKPGWSFGVFFSPEAVFYRNDSLDNTRSYGIDLNAYYKFSDYFLQSGIGFKFAHDRGNYLIDYNEYLGSYDHVYQVTFDSTSQGVIPTYHTYNVDVYDSVNHYTVTESKVRYTYFEIPLLFGYNKEFRNFNLYLAGGPNFSLLFNTRVDDASIPEEQIRIVNVEQQSPTRLDLNWQLVFRAGLGYKIGDRYSIMLEPTFKYYMKSEYDFMSNSAKPYSFGIRAGLIYHLSK